MNARRCLIALMLGLLAAGPVGAQGDNLEASPTALPENTAVSPEWSFSLRP